MTIKPIDKGIIASLSVAIIWGLSFVAASMVLETLSPVLLATLRFILASIIFSPILIRNRLKGNHPTVNDLKDMAFLGFLSISIYFWLQYTGVQYAGAGVSALIVVGFIPILTGLSSNLILKESFDKRRLLGVGLGFIGVTLITLPNVLISLNTRFFIGAACLLGNAICFSFYSTLSRRLLKKYTEPAIVTSYVTLFGTLALVPMSLTSDWSSIWVLSLSQWTAVFFLASICSGLAYFLWNYALSEIDSIEAAIWLYLEPVVAFLGVYILYGTLPDVLTVIGGILVLAGAVLTSRKT
jgi:drug/metabolite transporter (DMT)-like permease